MKDVVVVGICPHAFPIHSRDVLRTALYLICTNTSSPYPLSDVDNWLDVLPSINTILII
jgi:hypothetical protein